MTPDLGVGAQVGRYLIVKAPPADGAPAIAYDPALDRTVSLRVVDRTVDPRRAETMLATARALSRLTSPHVPRVHVGGVADDATWVAQEHEPSISLDGWLSRPRDRTATLRVLAGATRGVAAAHARGVVHGELQAECVRIGSDGRAWIDGFAATSQADVHDDRAALGVLLARSELPRSRAIGRAREAIVAGDLERAAEELDGTRARRRRGRTLILLAAIAVVPTGLVWERVVQSRAALCQDSERRLTGVWDDSTRASVDHAFARTEAPYAPAVRAEIDRRFDAYAASWIELHARACSETHVERTQDERVLDLRMRCLDARLQDLAALVRIFASADREVVARAVDATRGLAQPLDCMDADALALRTPPGPSSDERSKVDDIERAMAEARALEAAGRYADADAVVARLDDEAATLEHPATRAELTMLGARIAARVGRSQPARERVVEAIAHAWRAGHDELAADAWIELAFMSAESLGDVDGALRACDHAAAAIERIGGDARLEEELALTTGIALARAGRHEQALGRFEKALASLDESAEPDPLARSGLLNNLGIASRELGRLDEALDHQRRAIALSEPLLGATHPQIGTLLNNLGGVLLEHQEPSEALAAWTRAHAIQVAALGAEHPTTLTTLDNIGVALDDLQRDAEALETFRGTLARREAVLGKDHPAVGVSLVHFGEVLFELGRRDEADDAFTRALAVFEAKLGPSHPWVAHALDGLGRTTSDPDRALAHLSRALALREAVLGPTHQALAPSLFALAHVALDKGDPDLARAVLTRAEGIAIPSADPALAFAWARLLDLDGERETARQRANEAREQLVAGARSRLVTLATVDAWLAAQ